MQCFISNPDALMLIMMAERLASQQLIIVAICWLVTGICLVALNTIGLFDAVCIAMFGGAVNGLSVLITMLVSVLPVC
jgi:hypothetical protein